MKKLLSVIILFLLLCASVIAQADESSSCPTLSISGPAGITDRGETLEFAVDSTFKDVEKLDYKWSVSDGIIVAGQGKPWITVDSTREISNESITVKVIVTGFPEGCSNSAESTAYIAIIADPVEADEFGKLKPADEKARLDVFLVKLSNESEFKGYIVARFPKSTGASVIRKRIKRIKDHIFLVRKISKDRVVILVGSSENDSTVLWLLPPKHGESICSECKVY